MRCEHLPPWPQALARHRNGDVLLLDQPLRLGFERRALMIGAKTADLFGLVDAADGRQQALHGVERPVGIVSREGVPVRLLVANVTQLRGEGLLNPRKVVLEDSPLLRQHPQEHSRVALVVGDNLAKLGGVPRLQQANPIPTRAARCDCHPLLDEGQQPLGQQVEALADAFLIAQRCHADSLTFENVSRPNGFPILLKLAVNVYIIISSPRRS